MIIMQDDVTNDVSIFTVNAVCFVYNFKTVYKIVVARFFKKLHYHKCVLRSIVAFQTQILRLP